MTFNSIFNMVDSDLEGVYAFMEQMFTENYVELTNADRDVILSALRKLKAADKKDFKTFISFVSKDAAVYDILYELNPEGQYGFFTNGKDVDVMKLEGVPLNLVAYYSDNF